VEETLTVRREVAQNGLLGSAVIQDRVTDLLDIKGIVNSADPSFYKDVVNA